MYVVVGEIDLRICMPECCSHLPTTQEQRR
jgi:hypothetical protein